MAGEKTSLPWLDQYPGWLLYSLGVPQGANVFQQVKPNMYKQTFPGQKPGDVFGTSPLSRLSQDYNPWAALSSLGREGGPTGQESDTLNRSLFGTTAPLDLQNTRDAQAAKNNFVTSLSSGGKYSDIASEIYSSLGGRMGMPTAPNLSSLQLPNAPNLSSLTLPTAPTLDQLGSLPTGQDIGNTIFNTYNRFANNQPGFRQAQQSALNGGGILNTALAAMNQQGGAMDKFVNPLVSATEAASKRALANANTEMMSRFAGEGAFMSGPMLSALANQGQDYGVNLAKEIGGIRLQAANDQANRIYQGATSQAQIQAQQAQALSDQYARMAQETGSQQAALAASAYKAKADFLTNEYATKGDIYKTQVGSLNDAYRTQGDIYKTQAGFLNDQYGQQMQAFTAQDQLVQQQTTTRARDLMEQYGIGVDQAMAIATAQQKNEQSALDNLKNNYLQPGQETFAILKSLMGFPSVSKTTGDSAFGDFLSGLAQGAGQAGAAAAGGGGGA